MDIRSISLEPQHVAAYEKLKAAGAYKSLSAFVRTCINEHFESEFPDLEGEAALKRAEELEFAAASYRVQANKGLYKKLQEAQGESGEPELKEEPAAFTAQEEEIFKASKAGESVESD